MTATTGRPPSVGMAFIVIEIRTLSNYNTCIEWTSRQLQVCPKYRFEHKCFNWSSSLQNRQYFFLYYRQAKAIVKWARSARCTTGEKHFFLCLTLLHVSGVPRSVKKWGKKGILCRLSLENRKCRSTRQCPS